MPKRIDYSRGDIWWVELDPTRGKARKTRACLILQNNSGNKQSSLTTVAPFLGRKNYPFVVNVLSTKINGLDKERGLHLNQIRAVDCSRLKHKIGEIEDYYWKDLKKAIDIQLGFYL